MDDFDKQAHYSGGEVSPKFALIFAEIKSLHILLSDLAIEVAKLKEFSEIQLRGKSVQQLHVSVSHPRGCSRVFTKFKRTFLALLGGHRTNPIIGSIDSPIKGQRISGILEISGWVFSDAGPIKEINAFLDGEHLGVVPYGNKRPDVANAYPWQNNLYCGFSACFYVNDAIIASEASERLTLRIKDTVGFILDLTAK